MAARLVVVLVAVAALTTSAGASTGTGGWTLHVSGRMFDGVFTNPTGSVIDGVAIGTQLKAKNPIVSFTFAGQACGLYAAYGSAYCYTNISIGPGKSASFSGDARLPIGPGGLQMCSSADRGMDNTCLDVPAKEAVAVSSSNRKADAAVARARVMEAVSEEGRALVDLRKGDTLGARNDLAKAVDKLKVAMAYPYDAADVTGDLRSAVHDDEAAESELAGTTPGKLVRARGLVANADAKKRSAAAALDQIVHP